MRELARAGLAHGDLSPYNVLAQAERIVMIDLPQVVDIVGNPKGMGFLMRDCATWPHGSRTAGSKSTNKSCSHPCSQWCSDRPLKKAAPQQHPDRAARLAAGADEYLADSGCGLGDVHALVDEAPRRGDSAGPIARGSRSAYVGRAGWNSGCPAGRYTCTPTPLASVWELMTSSAAAGPSSGNSRMPCPRSTGTTRSVSSSTRRRRVASGSASRSRAPGSRRTTIPSVP
ncbi:RIO1 family regulatory kinase/ATPase [Actinomadura sp. NPDC048021]|uniref:RIO1 family regulatory kinase/ATPase domain-containing protein n=1 Tax=Actinomadura sp. NPDC048021 TaxID=3155385 RepID=UPI0033CCE5A9